MMEMSHCHIATKYRQWQCQRRISFLNLLEKIVRVVGIEPTLANTPMLWGMDLTIAHATNQYRKDLINEKKHVSRTLKVTIKCDRMLRRGIEPL